MNLEIKYKGYVKKTLILLTYPYFFIASIEKYEFIRLNI